MPHPLRDLGIERFFEQESVKFLLDSNRHQGISYKVMLEWPEVGVSYRLFIELEK